LAETSTDETQERVVTAIEKAKADNPLVFFLDGCDRFLMRTERVLEMLDGIERTEHVAVVATAFRPDRVDFEVRKALQLRERPRSAPARRSRPARPGPTPVRDVGPPARRAARSAGIRAGKRRGLRAPKSSRCAAMPRATPSCVASAAAKTSRSPPAIWSTR
jgi:beta-glucosidase-like glycosyl hydrolase